ncbi:di-heme oxidoredictase family protein [Methylopila sp. M107]|uniref:di-heme oxidoredictase family protein n=1 Tax=Methylopila sp. M107 TaxID=1101190 RepID=UPI00036593A9|nr:di-heme oxidoredictase family protein [Methylopila sp. M107]
MGAAIVLLASPASARDLDVAIGKAVFDRLWVQAPASTKSADGLGPLFAARACASCHASSGGRTTFRLSRDDPATHPGLVIRLGDAAGRPDPTYGAQLQPEGLGKAPGEGRASVSFTAATKGAKARPMWSVTDWGYGAPEQRTRASPRVAPSLAGVGLLARVPEAAILAREDPGDRDGDGVSGRAARLENGELGRFGWKASEPTIEAQAASAFLLDLGLSTTARPDPAGDCTEAEPQCLDAPHGAEPGKPEVAPELMAGLFAFVDRRPAPPSASASAKGEKLFAGVGCSACHAPSLPLSGGGEARAFTDLLLHDMGPDLDDGMGEGAAKSAEWRTAPLWGLSRALAQGSGLMHDGRADDVRGAISWHGGEAVGARKRFGALSPADGQALLDYVNGL